MLFRSLGKGNEESKLPNLFHYKYDRLFDYEALEEGKATRGVVGLPRVLNLYENYPFWHTFFTQLGFSVKLSGRSNKEIYQKGIATIPSESVCYPGKITHGHIMDLIEKKVSFIFYPCIPYEKKEDPSSNNHYNCPIVTSYPEVIKNNIDVLRDKGIQFVYPFFILDVSTSVIRIVRAHF